MPAQPQPAFPNPAATLPGEADILANVLADLSDDNAKLVYADWLEDRDDPRGPLLRNFLAAYRAGTKLPDVTSAPEPWRDVIGLTLIEEASEELAHHTDTFLRLARPALRLVTQVATDEELSVGVSKIGGSPDMPPDVEWPVWVRDFGEPKLHSFIAQINLADLRRSVVSRDLPSDGVLSFFWEQEDATDSQAGGWRVFHFHDIAGLVRRKNSNTRGWWSRPGIERVAFAETLSLPHHRNSPVSAELNIKYEDIGAYECLHSQFMGDYLLGHPEPLFRDALGGKENRLLFQLSSGEILYFTIHEDDLREQRFDRAGFAFQR